MIAERLKLGCDQAEVVFMHPIDSLTALVDNERSFHYISLRFSTNECFIQMMNNWMVRSESAEFRTQNAVPSQRLSTLSLVCQALSPFPLAYAKSSSFDIKHYFRLSYPARKNRPPNFQVVVTLGMPPDETWDIDTCKSQDPKKKGDVTWTYISLGADLPIAK